MVLIGGCQSTQISPWLQGETKPEASHPPGQAAPAQTQEKSAQEKPGASSDTKTPAPNKQVIGPPAADFPVMPAVAGPGPRPVIRFPFEERNPSGAVPTPSTPATEIASAGPASGEDKPQWPSFTPYLTRPPKTELSAQEQGPRSTVPLASGETVRVALLLPLTGPNAGLGKAMLNAAQLAVFNFADSSFELLTHDTKGTPGGAQQAASMAIGDGASMILGPLLSASARSVGIVAGAANVPVIAFSSDRSVAGGGTYTMGFLPGAEIKRIVAYARSKGVRRFAALAPDNVYGETVVKALRGAVAANGATLARIQFYDPFTTDFTPAVRAMAEYGPRRQALLAQRKELEGKEDEVSKRALKRLERLQTIGDLPYDALLLADGGKRLQSIAALLPFYDIDPAKVRMLGTGQWDMPGLGAEPALVGGWFAAPPPTARSDFESAYKETYGHAPPRLATLAYDATALSAVLAQSEKGPDFSKTAITVSSGFWGRDGTFRFLADGVAERGLAVMKVGRHEPEVISRAQETFQQTMN